MVPQPWPATLQDILNEASFSYNKGSTVIVSEMEVGPPKKRRRATKSVDTFSCSITVTSAQFVTFQNYFDTTLAGGTIPFYFNHPITQVPSIFEFIESWSLNSIGGGNFQITTQWRYLGNA